LCASILHVKCTKVGAFCNFILESRLWINRDIPVIQQGFDDSFKSPPKSPVGYRRPGTQGPRTQGPETHGPELAYTVRIRVSYIRSTCICNCLSGMHNRMDYEILCTVDSTFVLAAFIPFHSLTSLYCR